MRWNLTLCAFDFVMASGSDDRFPLASVRKERSMVGRKFGGAFSGLDESGSFPSELSNLGGEPDPHGFGLGRRRQRRNRAEGPVDVLSDASCRVFDSRRRFRPVTPSGGGTILVLGPAPCIGICGRPGELFCRCHRARLRTMTPRLALKSKAFEPKPRYQRVRLRRKALLLSCGVHT